MFSSRTRVRAAAVIAAVVTVFGTAAARADTASAATALPPHFAPYQCMGMFDIKPDYVTAWRSNPTTPETVWWTAWLQQWTGSGWATVPGSNFPWTSFPAAYNDPARGTVFGALIGGYLPDWWPSQPGTYRIVSQFYWSGARVYSGWEAGNACALSSFSIV